MIVRPADATSGIADHLLRPAAWRLRRAIPPPVHLPVSVSGRGAVQLGRPLPDDGAVLTADEHLPPPGPCDPIPLADKVIDGLSKGYDAYLDRRFRDGMELSGGQWQRIAIARGFYRDAPLLICDEPTAALDARSEHALFQTVLNHATGRTILLITHRLANVRRANRIYVLDRGRVVESGRHDELLAAGGLYSDLYTLQASAYHDGNGASQHRRNTPVAGCSA